MSVHLRKYGWPLVLFVGIPFVATISRNVTANVYDLYGSDISDSFQLSLWIPGVAGFTKAVLLGVLYPRLRTTERVTLRLAWSFTLVLAVVSTLLYLGAAFAGFGDSLVHIFGVYSLGTALTFLPMLWFARRASRISLTHAYFLVFIVGGVTLPVLPGSLPFYVGWLWSLAASILAVWLLANFDVRSFWFRRSAAVAVVILGTLAYVPELLPPYFLPFLPLKAVLLSLFPLKLVLIYLVRVRRPAAEPGLSQVDRPANSSQYC